MGTTMPFGLEPKNFLGVGHQHVSVRDRLADAFRRATIGLKAPSKVVARATGRTPECAERWLRGENAPSAEALILAMRDFDAVFEEVCAMAGRTRDSGQAEQLLTELAARLAERRR